jgi:pSer/pThr/pTyr-binding forkhead associated (FHA) protein
VLRLKEREIGRWEMDRAALRIGRTPDNDVVIDNLAVSRLHAVVEESKGEYFVRDCDSLNGTEVNGERIQRCRLRDGDEITIAKHTIVFRVPSGHAVIEPDSARAGFDQTMVFSRATAAPAPLPATPSAPSREVDATVAVATRRVPRLVARDAFGERIIEIPQAGLLIGSDESADIRIDGMFVPARHARIVVDGGRIVLQKLAGLRPVKVGGRSVREVQLKDNDEIQFGHESFVFHD